MRLDIMMVLVTINDGNEFGNQFSETYPFELILRKKNVSSTETSFLKLHLYYLHINIVIYFDNCKDRKKGIFSL